MEITGSSLVCERLVLTIPLGMRRCSDHAVLVAAVSDWQEAALRSIALAANAVDDRWISRMPRREAHNEDTVERAEQQAARG